MKAIGRLWPAMVVAVVLSGYFTWGEDAMAYEEPDYRVVATYPEFEVRRYAPYVVAETSVEGPFTEVGNQAFRRLFAYISEDKRPQGKIAMTTPVIQQPTGKRYRFAFVMPSGSTIENLPDPESDEVTLKEVPVRTMAARRYSGTWSEERYRANEAVLLKALKEEGLEAVGEPVFARYNAPFSLWFLRRNEVLIEVAAAD
ncbi:MAG: heme-binding protein [Desulfuromonadales bacterium]|nr:heme-binding protein [Desulfuromonadales bacterium]